MTSDSAMPAEELFPPKYQRFPPLSEEDEPFLAMLSPEHLQVLRQQGKMSEIAAHLGLPVGTVKSRLYRARQALRALRQQREH